MKTIIGLCILLLTLSASAIITTPFSSWEKLTQSSPDIVVVQCKATPVLQTNGHHGHIHIKDTQGWIDSDIEVVSILKGVTNSAVSDTPKLGSARLGSMYCPRQGEYYLVFSIFHDGEYQATEKYRIVPLGLSFDTNSLAGQTLDEQIKTLFQYRLNNLDRQMKEEQEEKARLEEFLIK